MKKKQQYNIKTNYLKKIYYVKDFIKTINRLEKKIIAFRKHVPIDAIAFTGTSGAAAAYPISYKLKIPLVCIRKARSSHYQDLYEGRTNIGKYIIIDDCIDTGRTVRRIRKIIKNEASQSKLVGIFLYAGGIYTKEIDKEGIININV